MTRATGTRANRALVAIVLLILLGTLLRLHGLDRSLWLDEAWVANSIRAETVGGMLQYESWLQTTPPLLLLLVRIGSDLLGEGNAALRAIPALLGILALPIFASVALRLLAPPFAVWAVLLLSLSPEVAWHSSSLKQYGGDVFAATALLALGLAYLERPMSRRLGLALLCFVPLGLLSYWSFFFFGPFLYGALLPGAAAGGTPARARPGWGRVLAAVAVGGVAGIAEWWLFVRPNTSTALFGFFGDGFPSSWGPGALLDFWARRVGILADAMPFTRPGGALRFGVLAIAAWGMVAWSLRARPRRFHHALLLVLPGVGFALANLLGVVPWSPRGLRILLFLHPPVALAFAAGCQSLAEAAFGRHRQGRGLPVVAWTLVVLCSAAVAFAGTWNGWERWLQRGSTQDAEGAVAALAERARPDDAVYVHASMVEQFAFYERRTPVATDLVVRGRIGSPCCPRGTALDWGTPADRVLPAELARIALPHPGGRLLLLATGHPRFWELVGRDDAALLVRALGPRGCRPEATEHFDGVRLDILRCGARGRIP